MMSCSIVEALFGKEFAWDVAWEGVVWDGVKDVSLVP